MSPWIAVVGAGLASYGLRAVPQRWAGRRPLSVAWQRRLALVGPAAFAALALPAVVHGGHGASPGPARAAAVAVALVVAHRTRSTAATLAAGMPTLWLASAMAGA